MAQILVVDDDPDLLTLVEMQLSIRPRGVKAERSSSDRDDGSGAPDVAVLDVAMPGMNGIDVLVALRSMDDLAACPRSS